MREAKIFSIFGDIEAIAALIMIDREQKIPRTKSRGPRTVAFNENRDHARFALMVFADMDPVFHQLIAGLRTAIAVAAGPARLGELWCATDGRYAIKPNEPGEPVFTIKQIAIASVAGIAPGLGVAALKDTMTDPTVDITFSLECPAI
jgi:hypothetical protein